MRLAGSLIRFPLAVLGEVVDRLLGPNELKDCTWPATTPPGEDDLCLPGRQVNFGEGESAYDLAQEEGLLEEDPTVGRFGYEIVAGKGW